ncbi:MAG TPA: hypothetical protein VKJ01_16490 [Candidatus Solibacter sp.]|nr:hypothetical protein [Candidatus Solibacter sp.]
MMGTNLYCGTVLRGYELILAVAMAMAMRVRPVASGAAAAEEHRCEDDKRHGRQRVLHVVEIWIRRRRTPSTALLLVHDRNDGVYRFSQFAAANPARRVEYDSEIGSEQPIGPDATWPIQTTRLKIGRVKGYGVFVRFGLAS